ncbi:integral membrane [Pyrenophora seminiperda CCB06]|uniref:Integral membrane n=1 Tax=Pyrenophora seminiperda CCB06 TaxID=1302712 RepID=A0A3M7ME69_9PLEO|nr:integral membrane [Pyrenophora seminiperda CCB06]
MIMLKWLFWSIIFYNISLCATKVSILLQYRRIFTVPEMRIPLALLMAFIVTWGLISLLLTTFTCVPVYAYWDVLAKPTARCIKNNSLWYMNASFNIVTDICVAFLPVRVIWNLQLARRQKVALIGVLTIGWFVCIVSILRLIVLREVFNHAEDNSYYSAPAAYWSGIEVNLAIVCASLPSLKQLIVKLIPGFSSRHSGRGYGTGASGRVPTIGTRRGRSTARQTGDFELEAGIPESPHSKMPKSPGDSAFDKNIYISRHYEAHSEQASRLSDSESQAELVVQQSNPVC